MATEVPTIGLAQLVYADLLSGLTLSNPGFATYPPTLQDASAERLDDLAAEARASPDRRGQPPAGWRRVPSQFVHLGSAVRHAIAVDVSKSRLYVFEKHAGRAGAQARLLRVGRQARLLEERIEGDLRTPLGIYFITGSIARNRLAERFGAGALPLNYPKPPRPDPRPHGQRHLASRCRPHHLRAPTLATDGCVAVSNPDLRELSQWVNANQTPVVIADKLTWVEPSAVTTQQAAFMTRFNAWRDARQSKTDDLQAKFYATPRSTLGRRGSHPGRTAPARRSATCRFAERGGEEPVVLAWQDDDDIMVVTFTEATARDSQARLKRQYWLRKGGEWNIIYEAAIG